MQLNTDMDLPRMRFLNGLERLVQLWLWICVLGLIGSLFGLNPTWMSLLAFGGVIWVPLVALVLWGRWLDEILNFQSDETRGPR
ncbi:MAG: hypothetical protein AAGH74_15240 [Pseudomonadota bacterium]